MDIQKLSHAREVHLLQCEIVRLFGKRDPLHVNANRADDLDVVLDCTELSKCAGGKFLVGTDDRAEVSDNFIDNGQGVLNTAYVPRPQEIQELQECK